jgi:CRISPR/Cas system CMR subunit Cmr6 (Cas7 group RAMP superfamily)
MKMWLALNDNCRYHTELAQAKNQEVTIKRLQDEKERHEKQFEETVETKVKELEKQLNRSFGQKERDIQQELLVVCGMFVALVSHFVCSIGTLHSRICWLLDGSARWCTFHCCQAQNADSWTFVLL